jgi:Tol biopolymer transport system component
MLALLLFAASAATVPTIDQTLGFRTATNPKISPDARYVAYVVQQTDWEENAFETEIWVYSAATGERYQLTSGKKSSWAPAWSPDSKLLAFLSDRDGKAQIYTISPTGGEAIA